MAKDADKEPTIRELAQELGRLGGLKNSAAQRTARQQNLRKAAEKRRGSASAKIKSQR